MKSPHKSHKQLLSALATELPPHQNAGGWIRTNDLYLWMVCMLLPLGTGLFARYSVMALTEHGLGPHGQVAGFVPVNDVVAQLGLRHFEEAGQGLLDDVVAGE